ncbi:serine/threonine-protein kinase [Paenibacillus tyrfis]|uniref:Serine/threonine protein kinase n=1 Tax=Paenibacillus tyrfis TaxID=1501230 RepID=A0A081P1F3_9BACL|nr:serine/threonine protein kinase [Paenibacillus tyrfis]KEQ24526.1 serine/threonine protein kinase [Paenibacillus tyrfis]
MTNHSVTVNIDGISFQLKEPHPFEWLRKLGRVFCVFDQQDSGNLSFGIEWQGRKKFVKYAGAPTVAYTGTPQEAVHRLKQALPLYEALNHPHLIRLEEHFEVHNGYAAVFDWFDGECLHSHWSFPPPQKYTHPDSPFFRFRQLPVEERLRSLDCIFSFHAHVETSGYVAVDFYDGSILYDFKNNVTKICDIDFYQKKPFINTMGRLWGSSRFMSPEEFELGADIDARTNVFNMGAIAFGLLGGERDRSYSKWEAGEKLYETALRAVRPDRNERYASVAEFYAAWNAVANCNL